MAEALRRSEWTAAEAAREAAEAEAHDEEALRSAEAASRCETRSEGQGGDGGEDEELRRACAESLTSSRVRYTRAHAYSTAAHRVARRSRARQSTPPHASSILLTHAPFLTLGVPHTRSRARSWRATSSGEEAALARAKADSLKESVRESGVAEEAEAEELRRALQLSCAEAEREAAQPTLGTSGARPSGAAHTAYTAERVERARSANASAAALGLPACPPAAGGAAELPEPPSAPDDELGELVFPLSLEAAPAQSAAAVTPLPPGGTASSQPNSDRDEQVSVGWSV